MILCHVDCKHSQSFANSLGMQINQGTSSDCKYIKEWERKVEANNPLNILPHLGNYLLLLGITSGEETLT